MTGKIRACCRGFQEPVVAALDHIDIKNRCVVIISFL